MLLLSPAMHGQAFQLKGRTMPLIYVTLKKGKPVEYRNAIHAGIQNALIEIFKLPDDDYAGVTLQVDPDEMYYDRNFFEVPRSEDLIFIDMSWNKRTPEIKQKLFEKIADNLEASPGLKRADILLTVKETPSENWWVHGRTVNPDTGLDSRIQHVPAGSLAR
jgi:phenylpyruvate tautomerase PptA (4-oxalocrotonate tautomerase family)